MILAGEIIPVVVLAIIVGTFAVISLIAFIIYKLLHPKFKDEDKFDEENAVKENLDRVLVDVEDKETAEAIANYHDEEEDELNLSDEEKDARDYQLQRGMDMVIAMARVRDGLSFVPATPEDEPAVASDDKEKSEDVKKDDKKSDKKK